MHNKLWVSAGTSRIMFWIGRFLLLVSYLFLIYIGIYLSHSFCLRFSSSISSLVRFGGMPLIFTYGTMVTFWFLFGRSLRQFLSTFANVVWVFDLYIDINRLCMTRSSFLICSISVLTSLNPGKIRWLRSISFMGPCIIFISSLELQDLTFIFEFLFCFIEVAFCFIWTFFSCDWTIFSICFGYFDLTLSTTCIV